MNKYQVSYKYNTKSFVDTYEFFSIDALIDFFDSVNACEIIEIRHYVYEDYKYIEDDKNYIHSYSVSLTDDRIKHSVRVPKIKKTVSSSDFEELVKTHIKMPFGSLKTIKITQNFK